MGIRKDVPRFADDKPCSLDRNPVILVGPNTDDAFRNDIDIYPGREVPWEKAPGRYCNEDWEDELLLSQDSTGFRIAVGNFANALGSHAAFLVIPAHVRFQGPKATS